MKNIKLHNFNNLNKNINISIYKFDFIYKNNLYKKYINYINIKYSSKKLIKKLKKICNIINAKILNIALQDYTPQGASATLLISENNNNIILSHLNKSHICIHTYPENYYNKLVYINRIDFNISTCGVISPLKCINQIIKNFKSQLITIDYIIRGFTQDIYGKKYFIDHKINSIQNYINTNIKKKYDFFDINIYKQNIFFTKMLIKKINIKNNIFSYKNSKFNKKNLDKKIIISYIWKEIYQIFYNKKD